MTTEQIANRLVELCRTGAYETVHNELYSKDVESIEPETAQEPRHIKGIEAIKEKGKQFQGMVEEVHGGYVSNPVIAGNRFSVAMGMDVTMKGMGRLKMDEIAVYEVKDGKVVKEQFFY